MPEKAKKFAISLWLIVVIKRSLYAQWEIINLCAAGFVFFYEIQRVCSFGARPFDPPAAASFKKIKDETLCLARDGTRDLNLITSRVIFGPSTPPFSRDASRGGFISLGLCIALNL